MRTPRPTKIKYKNAHVIRIKIIALIIDPLIFALLLTACLLCYSL
jgi:hypothetical protein